MNGKKGINTVKKKMSRAKVRLIVMVLFVLLQLSIMIVIVNYCRSNIIWFYGVFELLGLGVVIHILNTNDNPAYKLAWIVPILALPVFGMLMYFAFRKHRPSRRTEARLRAIERKYRDAVAPIASRRADVYRQDPDAGLQAGYLEKAAMAPVYGRTQTQYFPLGDDMFPVLLEELRKAKKFIFMEYFIVSPGVMWDEILEVLKEKAKEGVDVRFMYDDFGCILSLPVDYDRELESMGIKACVFNRFNPALSGSYNNRDHRKICVIDGNVSFTGGINLADEYINKKERFGHWLDCGVMLKGEGTWSFTVMFLSMWDYVYQTDSDFTLYKPDEELIASLPPDGYVQPYTDSPADEEPSGETAYLNMIAKAKRYVYICTPYLIIDNELTNALCNAAKSGVDVRIMTPGVPDKVYAYALTRSYYEVLVAAGVKIYEYAPGFIHSKSFVSDDSVAICGTINLDYRSLFLHYECAVWMYRAQAVGQIRDSFMENLPKCRQITMSFCRQTKWHIRLIRSLLKVFAPLM